MGISGAESRDHFSFQPFGIYGARARARMREESSRIHFSKVDDGKPLRERERELS